MARLVRERSQDGKRLVDFWFAVLDNTVPGLEGQARVADMNKAAEVLAERGWGAPKQEMEHSGADGEPLQIVVTTYREGA